MTVKKTNCSDCVRGAAIFAWVAKPAVVLAAAFMLSGNGDDAGPHKSFAQTFRDGLSSIQPVVIDRSRYFNP